MSFPSNWPLNSNAVRFILPKSIVDSLSTHSLSRDLYPTSMGFYSKARGHTVTREKHDDCLFLYCIEGQATAEVKGRALPVKAGDLLVFPSGMAHSYFASDADPWSVYWVHFSGGKSNQHLKHVPFSQKKWIYPFGVRTTLISNFKLLLESRHSPQQLNAAIHAAQVLRQLICYLALLLPKEDRSRGRLNIETIHALMQMQLGNVLQLDELARSANLSKYQFAHEYRRLTGSSPIAHLIQMKIEKACFLLDTSSLPIKEISSAVGYDDPYYFSRLFKKIMGYSPEYYRNLDRG